MPISQILLARGPGNGGGGGGGNPPADFTIEWWQKVENNSNNPRPWSVGLYPTQQLAISYESGLSDYFWVNNSFVNNTVQSHIGAGWRHIAYVRSGGVIRGYINGTQYTPNITSTELIIGTDVPLYVGTGETGAGTYKGYITNLHIMRGVAKYTSQFTPSTTPTQLTAGSVFLLPALNDESKFYNSAETAIGSETGTVAWSSDTPFATDGPYIQSTNQSSTNAIDFSGDNYNADLLNVKAGWIVSDGAGQTGTVTSDAVDLGGNYIRIGITFTPVNAPSTTWTFTQPALGGSLYFNGSSYLNYGGSPIWAIDAP
jgi:hypothetical protein